MEYHLRTKLNGNIAMTSCFHENSFLQRDRSLYKFIWVRHGALDVEVDHVVMHLEKEEMISLTPLHHVQIRGVDGEYLTFLFNSNFYCIYGHDSEVSCNGFLFNGSSRVMRLKLSPSQSARLDSIVDIFMRITTNELLANLWFNLLVRMDGFESGSIVPRRYRIEMTNVNEKTGECTLGNLEVFSRSKGWVPGQDPSIARHTASKFPSLSGGAHDLGIAADYFKGCTLKLAKKRDDVLWYPPLEWAKSQTEYDKKIEKMKDTYLHFITDCEALFGL